MLFEKRKTGKKTVTASGVVFGGQRVVLIAGPCSVESRSQLLEIAAACKEAGAEFLRGGAFKPRTSPYSFQGLKEKGLELLAEAREKTCENRHRSAGVAAARRSGRSGGYVADRLPQYAEFCFAPRCRGERQAGLLEARHVLDHKGIFAGSGVCAESRVPAGRALRTRHTDI